MINLLYDLGKISNFLVLVLLVKGRIGFKDFREFFLEDFLVLFRKYLEVNRIWKY